MQRIRYAADGAKLRDIYEKVIFVVATCVLGVFNASGCVVQTNDDRHEVIGKLPDIKLLMISIVHKDIAKISAMQRVLLEKRLPEAAAFGSPQLQERLEQARLFLLGIERDLVKTTTFGDLKRVTSMYAKYNSAFCFGEDCFFEQAQVRETVFKGAWLPFVIMLEQNFTQVSDSNIEGKIMAGIKWEMAEILLNCHYGSYTYFKKLITAPDYETVLKKSKRCP